MSKVLVIGGGPAGCFAAIAAAEQGHQVVLLERNEKIGKKLFITGKGIGELCTWSNYCRGKENAGRCSSYCNRRLFLCIYRFYRGWLSFRRSLRTYHKNLQSIPCAF